MLYLQKASAGSGKTYTLARRYLQLLLTTGSPARLRTEAELEDAARHILAITFTNKATAEMKARIVQRLADLADPALPENERVYLDDFKALTNRTAEEIRQTAATALAVLLNNYTDFQVSTIDSFFQTILRTFAYEIDLNDSYQIELDSDFVAASALDATMTDINSGDNGDSQIMKWFNTLMSMKRSEKATWNIFSKSNSKFSFYADVLAAIKQMSGEKFKEIRDTLEDYFNKVDDTAAAYKELDAYLLRPVSEARDNARNAAIALRKALLAPPEGNCGTLAGRMRKILNSNLFTPTKGAAWFKVPDKRGVYAAFTKKSLPEKNITAEHEHIAGLAGAMYDAAGQWEDALASPPVKLWMIYRRKLQYLPLMFMASQRSAKMLREANMVWLDETNSILRRVIGDDDTPFIYERLGSRLNHFLIDEFQDTSALQWENITHLIDESLSHGHDNLIIGDAKQSIYRFRNADSSLITTKVPAQYKNQIVMRGDRKEENTNHRSLRNIVEFNNSLFHTLARSLDAKETEMRDGEPDGFFAALYSNVAQYPKAAGQLGYIELNICSDEKEASGDDDNDAPYIYMSLLPQLVNSLLERGYKQRDIAFLVRTKREGDAVVATLLRHNLQYPGKAINFVSDESLKIASAASVKTILAVLRLLADGTIAEDEETPAETEAHTRRKISLPLFRCLYEYFASRHPDIDEGDMMRSFNESSPGIADIMPLLRRLRSMALPDIVESVTEQLVSSDIKTSEAPYIAAFQDIVVDYCEKYPSDTLSFLQYWQRIETSATINSPSGIDAVNIMTIHKAKGLEFPCVILPSANETFNPRSEWAWVKPDLKTLGLPDALAAKLPGVLPIETSGALLDTAHREMYAKLYRDALMDAINIWYVACTRAIGELYIFAGSDKNDTFAGLCKTMLEQLGDSCGPTDSCEYPLPGNLVDIPDISDDDFPVLSRATVGEPLTRETVEDKFRHEPEEGTRIEKYYVRDPGGILHFKDPGLPRDFDPRTDSRSIGNRLHSVMADIRTAGDLAHAVRKRVADGSMTPQEGEETMSILSEKLSAPAIAEWFAPGLKAITERPLLKKDNATDYRPDRIIITNDNRATVIDYKFGNIQRRKYIAQVANYVEQLRQTGQFAAVDGYVWYVLLDTIITAG